MHSGSAFDGDRFPEVILTALRWYFGYALSAQQLRPQLEQLEVRDRFDVADAAALPWPDSSVDLVVTSPPYCNGVSRWVPRLPQRKPA